MSAHIIKIDNDGHLHFVCDDALVELLDAGDSVRRRASYVEPCDGPGNGWTADMSPSGGPVLGPFRLRAEALAAERAWLAAERGL